jgi:predicted DCC family thiol-disulfide oxidoreductase YuxK
MKLKIFFDGSCHICSREIIHYSKITPKGFFEYINVAGPQFKAEQFQLDPKKVNQEMHVQLPSGEIKTGVEAFISIWKEIPRYHWLAKIISLPVIFNISKVFYIIFARGIRPFLPKRKYCEIPN